MGSAPSVTSVVLSRHRERGPGGFSVSRITIGEWERGLEGQRNVGTSQGVESKIVIMGHGLQMGEGGRGGGRGLGVLGVLVRLKKPSSCNA